MTAGITKRPADRLVPITRGVVYLALGTVFAVGTWGMASTTRNTYRQPGKEWVGNEDMSTSLVRIESGAHTIRWEAPCVLDVDLWANDGEDVFVEQAGLSASGSHTMNLPTGYYFLSVGATCDWVASIR